jgi:hypothetical protein
VTSWGASIVLVSPFADRQSTGSGSTFALKPGQGRGALPWRQALRCQTAPRHGVLAPTAAGTGEQIKSRKLGGRKTAPLNDAVNSVPFGNSMVNAVYSQITQERDRVDHIALAGGITANETSASRRVELEMLL